MQLITEKLNNSDKNSQSEHSKNIFIEQALDLMKNGVFCKKDVEEESNVIVFGVCVVKI